MTLEQLGWNDRFAAAFAPHAAAGCVPARVTLELKGFFEVTGAEGARLGECSGKFARDHRSAADYPAIGDWVAVAPQPGDDTRAIIHAVLPRRTKFSRKAAGEHSVEQVVAANVDTVFLVAGLDGNYNLHRMERYLAAAWASGAEPVVLLNKADLNDDTQALIAELGITGRGVPVHVVSAQTRRGLKALAPYLVPGRTVALLGSSGVGKSTLINRLVGERLQDTQEVREADNKGRHTTTQRELIVTPSGVIVIDTPGMRELQPWDASAGIDAAFGDVTAVTARCKFRDCAHGVEPGCAVQAALADGSLDPARWSAWQRLQRAAAYEVRRVNPEARQLQKKDIKKITKQLRQRVHEKSGEE
ncbi:ribosome small subunit-dependent GTPase A [Oleiharenicola lentus]|uniref:Small ribosomal subunit biogenesis GTPase RsgA n=1 Tax=Oleiharenicola lentus TaxID=2508720 RepID=A0A4V1M6C1_9BACT|nr:ribosome small subunit-dependent GTPase A [Oleiharenicola lentus]RXK54879.1 ribosome small subunit-dependent GTPase A [Oleiharenicola lentus]